MSTKSGAPVGGTLAGTVGGSDEYTSVVSSTGYRVKSVKLEPLC